MKYKVLPLLFVVFIISVSNSIFGDTVIFESASLGKTGQEKPRMHNNHGQYVGVKFEITKSTTVREIGGHFVPRAGRPTEIFAAVVKLDNQDDFPDSIDLSTKDVLGYTNININKPSGEYSGIIDLKLESGWYCMVFGTQLFNIGFMEGGLPLGDKNIGEPLYFVGYTDFILHPNGWYNMEFQNRFFITGKTLED